MPGRPSCSRDSGRRQVGPGRRLADLLGIGVYRYDGSGASDNMFGGSPKGWGNTVPSAPARAVNQTRIANPVVTVDEIEGRDVVA